MSHFTSLSGRDTNAIDIIKKVANLDAPLLLDPTLLMDSYDPYIEKCNEKNYILVYGWFFKDEDKQAIKEFAKSKNLKLISVGFKLKWCDEFIGSDIFRFLSYMKDATYVVTSETFHGNVFSAYYNKQFVATTHGRAKSRELLERLGLGERDCYSPEEIKEKLNKSIDYRNVNKWLEMERNKAIDYLKNSIEG